MIIGFSGMPDLVMLSAITLDIALWVKSKIAAICLRSNNKLIAFTTQGRQIHIFDVYYRVLRYVRHSGVVGKYFRHCIVDKKIKMAVIPRRDEVHQVMNVDECS